MNNTIAIEDLIKAGAHFGHPTSRWHPGFSNYISMKKMVSISLI